MATLDELVIRIRADTAQLERALKNAQQQTQDTGNRMRAVLTDLRGQFAALVPALSVAAVVSFGKQAIAAADHINDLAQRTGFAGSTLSALNTPLKQSGSSLDEFAASMARLNNALGEAATGDNQSAVQAFDDLGLSVKRLLALPQEERFFAVARALSGLKDITQQQAAAQNLMGRGAAVLIPLINELGGNLKEFTDEAKASGRAISDEDLKRIDEFGDKWTAVVEQLQVSFTAFTPVLDAVVEAFQTLRVLNPVELGSRIGKTIGEEITGQGGYTRKAKAGGFATEATVVSGYTFDSKGNLVPPGAKSNPAAGSNAGLLKGDKDTEKAAEDYDTLNNEMERYLTNLENERELAGLSGKALEVRKAILEATAIATKEGNLLSEETVQQITAEVGATYDLQEAQRKLEQQTREAAETQRELTNAFRDGLTDIVLHFDSARDAAKNFFEEIASQIIKRKITGPLAQGIGDAIGGSDFLSGIGSILGFADGGRPPVGRASIVGENGPELFVPDSAGTVIPNGAMGGKSVTVVNNWNISPGIQGTVRQELMNMLPAIEARTKASVFGAIERGGSESRMVGKRS